MSDFHSSYTTVRVLADYPFSRVEIVRKKKKLFILKSVPTFIGDIEFRRQKFVFRACKKIVIPRIYWIKRLHGRVYCLMDYYKKDGASTPQGVILNTISAFHRETAGARSDLFPFYDLLTFKEDLPRIREWLPHAMAPLSDGKLCELFADLFASGFSILHGDWCRNQLILSGGKKILLDFGMALIGPSILDHAHFFMKHERISGSTLRSLGVDRSFLRRAIVLEAMRHLGWIRRGIESPRTTYKFEAEIKADQEIIARAWKHLAASSDEETVEIWEKKAVGQRRKVVFAWPA